MMWYGSVNGRMVVYCTVPGTTEQVSHRRGDTGAVAEEERSGRGYKIEVAPGVTVASLRRFRTALIGPTQGLPKRRRLCR